MVTRLNLISVGQTVLWIRLVFHSLVTTRVSKVKLADFPLFLPYGVAESELSGLVGRGE